jgi:hypothetical protein
MPALIVCHCLWRPVMRTAVTLDEALRERAQRLSGLRGRVIELLRALPQLSMAADDEVPCFIERHKLMECGPRQAQPCR